MRISILSLITTIFILQSCYKDIGPIEPSQDTPVENISFSKDIQPVFDNNCVACHPPSGNLDLSSGNSYNAIVNVNASGYSGLLVKPGEPENSVLYQKINGSGEYGGNMPPGGTLMSSQIEMIRQWIVEGAKNN